MKFETKRSFFITAGVSSFIFSVIVILFAVGLMLFPDFILSFSNLSVWNWLIVDIRLYVVIWAFTSAAAQITSGIFLVLQKTEEECVKFKGLYISAFVLTTVLGCFVTLGILLAQLLLSVKPNEEEVVAEDNLRLEELKELKAKNKISKEEFEREAEKILIKDKKG